MIIIHDEIPPYSYYDFSEETYFEKYENISIKGNPDYIIDSDKKVKENTGIIFSGGNIEFSSKSEPNVLNKEEKELKIIIDKLKKEIDDEIVKTAELLKDKCSVAVISTCYGFMGLHDYKESYIVVKEVNIMGWKNHKVEE